MATLYITEYVNVASAPAGGGSVGQMPLEPPVAEQTVSIGGSSTQSATFNSSTRFVRLHTDSVCSIEFGTNPTATTLTGRKAANQTEYHGVPANQGFKVAVIANA